MHFLDPKFLITSFGHIGLVAIIFAETGLFFGFFLPGDSLLFTAGLLASQGYLNIWLLVALLPIASIAGNIVGYHFGKVAGPRIFRHEESIFFHKDHIARAEKFFEKHGPKSLIMARFMPIVRTFVPIVAGVGRMNYRKFMIYNVLGGIIWIGLLLALGYILGATVPDIDRYLLPIIVAIIIISFIPALISFWKR
jgi:membrane-associated protein